MAVGVAARRALLRWYDERGRDLPWRRTADPYAIWVAEVMLQQTRVAAAAPYWERFLARFPTVEALARAREDDVLAAWAGLGYYRRARHLHAAAKVLARDGWPTTRAGLAELPGFGPYTSASVAAIAFGRRELAADGNVRRVARRLFAVADDGAAVARAGALVAKGRPGDSNQALFDLGATVCTPRAPRCGDCPLAAACAGREAPMAWSAPRPRAAAPVVAVSALLARDGTRVRLVRREEGLLAGTWALPFVEGGRAELGRAHGARVGRRLGAYEHAFTHRRWRVTVFAGETRAGAWRDPGGVAVATAFRKALDLAAPKGRTGREALRRGRACAPARDSETIPGRPLGRPLQKPSDSLRRVH